LAVAAVLVAIVTVLVGVVVLGDVVGPPGSGIKRLAFTHVGVALVGVTLLLVALVDASRGMTWISLAALVLAGGIGGATLTVNRPPGRDGAATAAQRTEEGHLPLTVVVIHGAAAILTVVLVLAAAAAGPIH
jgi:hypothetical protein